MPPTPAPPQLAAFKRGDVLLVLTLLVFLALLAGREGGGRLALLAGIGAFAGLALYHASFGFTAAWRRFLIERRSGGIRAQLIMLGVASLVFFPLIAAGSLFGRPISGFVFPIGVALVLGAFLFGVGMQLGGGCGSGTLFTIGGGSVRMLVTLAFFILGSTLATAFSGTWLAWPSFEPVSIIARFGMLPAMGMMLGGLALLFLLAQRMERARHGTLAAITTPDARWITGPWPLIAGALALAGVNIAVLIVNGWPWGITSAFALWGTKIAQGLGFAVTDWAYWRGQEASLAAPVLADATSVMDFAIILGAMLAAMLADKFAPNPRIPLRSLAAAVIGGLLLGIGARLGTGCNIGAFFSGTVSGSLHGWVWLIAALVGNAAGLRLRALFRLD